MAHVSPFVRACAAHAADPEVLQVADLRDHVIEVEGLLLVQQAQPLRVQAGDPLVADLDQLLLAEIAEVAEKST